MNTKQKYNKEEMLKKIGEKNILLKNWAMQEGSFSCLTKEEPLTLFFSLSLFPYRNFFFPEILLNKASRGEMFGYYLILKTKIYGS